MEMHRKARGLVVSTQAGVTRPPSSLRMSRPMSAHHLGLFKYATAFQSLFRFRNKKIKKFHFHFELL